MEYKIEIDGDTYTMSELYSVTITQPLFEQFSVGNACSGELKVTFLPHGNIGKMAKFVPFGRESSDSKWIQLGVFYLDTREQHQELMSITAYDDMLKAEIVWTPDQSLNFPMTMSNAVEEISDLMGVSIDSRTVLSNEYTIDYPANDYTLREILQYIAAAHGGNWIITATGQLLLVPLFDSMPVENNHLVTENGDAITFGGVKILV